MSALFYNVRFTLSRWSALRADRIDKKRLDRKLMGIVRAFEAQQGER